MCNALAMTPFLKLLLLYFIICKRDQMWFTAYVRLTAHYGITQITAYGLLLYLTSSELHLMTLTL